MKNGRSRRESLIDLLRFMNNWQDELINGDPYYNSNFNSHSEDCSL